MRRHRKRAASVPQRVDHEVLHYARERLGVRFHDGIAAGERGLPAMLLELGVMAEKNLLQQRSQGNGCQLERDVRVGGAGGQERLGDVVVDAGFGRNRCGGGHPSAPGPPPRARAAGSPARR